MAAWTFADPPNLTCFSTRGVMERDEPILLVTHEADDGSWTFIGYDWAPDALVVVCLEHAVHKDSTVRELADLPRGWAAQRDYASAPWARYQMPAEDAGE